MRLTRIRGRSDDMLIIRGVNVFPQRIEALLMENQNLSPNYRIIVDRVNNLDTLEVQVEMNETLFADEIRKLQSLESTIQKNIKEFLGVTTQVRLYGAAFHPALRRQGQAHHRQAAYGITPLKAVPWEMPFYFPAKWKKAA